MALIEIKGNVYELPKMTLELETRFLEAAKPTPDREKQTTEKLSIVLHALPRETVQEELGGIKASTVDVVELRVLFRKIWDAYQKPANDEAERDNAETIKQAETAKELLDQMSRAVELLEKHQAGASRQGFSRVV